MSSEPVHILLCYSGRYSDDPSDFDETINEHNRVAEETGYVWWGKFQTDAEAFAENEPYWLADLKKQKIMGIPTLLFLCNPKPSNFLTHVGRIDDFTFGLFGATPNDHNWRVHVPRYYFEENQDQKENETALKFQCRYWFKIMKTNGDACLKPINPAQFERLVDVSDTDVPHTLSFARSNFFPMPVKIDSDSSLPLGKQDWLKMDFIFIRDTDRSQIVGRWNKAINDFDLGDYRGVVQEVGEVSRMMVLSALKPYGMKAVNAHIAKHRIFDAKTRERARKMSSWQMRDIRDIAMDYEILSPWMNARCKTFWEDRGVAHPDVQEQKKLNLDKAFAKQRITEFIGFYNDFKDHNGKTSR